MGATEHMQKAVKEVVNAQLTLMQLVESVNRMAGQLEKAKFLLSASEAGAAWLWGLLALAFAASASLWLWMLLASGGEMLRGALWLAGGCALLPRRGRATLREVAERTGLLEGNSLGNAWQRIPDGVEVCHLRLVERYALIGAETGRCH
mmetsp:Transcript_43250/g.135209  ORF Transcript_43250/g.135209 Transcript_43250/m.135209 type:complete len:149 (+) Transcript_43250:413-859(+)